MTAIALTRAFYPTHLIAIAIAAICLTLVLNPSAQATIKHLLLSSNSTAEGSPHSPQGPSTSVASSSHFQSNGNITPHRPIIIIRETRPNRIPRQLQHLALSSLPFLNNSSRSTPSGTDITKRALLLVQLARKTMQVPNDHLSDKTTTSLSPLSPESEYGNAFWSSAAFDSFLRIGTGRGATMASNEKLAAPASMDGMPDMTHTRDNLIGDGGSRVRGLRDHMVLMEEVKVEVVETVHPTDSSSSWGLVQIARAVVVDSLEDE
ncbi:hypothetical protein K435DRAFT_875493 [Dendrothele bispora CBS 962.96]|uniref:Uncharacterized protein n=1 Tax=Dendrothele bispora (strain CBS 962.96) TaxID=1314807 RepID=A0A4S8KUH0_DENBC|nr:hypothetical protein K435DRAFT_875493 [Dendrothele bispora CBS 962.96]